MFRNSVSRLGLERASQRFFSQTLKNTQKSQGSQEYLSKFYSPEMLQSLKITESLVDPKTYIEMKKGGRGERSKVAPDASKRFSETDPKWDEPILYPNQGLGSTPYAPIPREANPDTSDLKMRFTVDESTAERKPRVDFRANRVEKVALLTGFNKDYIRRLHVVNVLVKRVSCQTSKGKIPNFYAMTIVGDRNGMVGMGEGKSRQGVKTALEKGFFSAVKNLQPIARYEDRTIIGEIDYKFHAVKLSLKSAPAGFGLRINPVLFEVCEAAGIKDLRGKITRSRNRMNTVKGFFEALTKERSIEELAAGRGKKIVDLRKVYYSA
ncbi:hypothetical protein FT663_00221 [Candidozyma haemuli var. vulneris]|uniref:Small ribosomal subunit protein uS5m n=1 Tax=Candidozyma haemuli TaxID=45357 RepID=A0A2V1APD7_9ASCO|nr:hypothetical protein CXQ85_003596 [[Candida] haemuloni]KAF3993551.1 hypothetical protein FT662_00471 [[Candida] haemuloni var. vulneris]KAF3995625.1 hypothetical protein FT663_00221 [[Candida] haemuloni var. vulneris]PVH19739.1 hypothetical protein CXQ85_003596 [[Candida] haemuloni]